MNKSSQTPSQLIKGLVVGKFYPPHKGHHYLIEYALDHSDELDILVCDHPSFRIPVSKRVKWLQKAHPAAHVWPIPDIEKEDDSAAWAVHTERFLGYTPDIVFSSEDYGDTYAKCMGAKHHKLDRERVHVPIRASHIRPDVLKHWDFMQPHVRSQFAVRVCVLGAESTGTTTLTRALAQAYQTPWVSEYGRLYSESLADPLNHPWQSDEFAFIARQQQKLEDQLAGISNGLLFCDTNAFATRLWHERYIGNMSVEVDKIAGQDHVDLYILTGDEIPFEQDGVRDGENIRHAMHKRFLQELQNQDIPFIVCRGTVRQRLKVARQAVDDLMNQKVTI